MLDIQTKNQHKNIIMQAFEHYPNCDLHEPNLQKALHTTLTQLDQGSIRVAEKDENGWHVNQWLKQAIMLYLRSQPSQTNGPSCTPHFDKLPSKFSGFNDTQFNALGTRVVPPTHVRYGAFIGKQTVLMPSFVNIGAYVDEGCMIDTWATVGCSAQIGKHVHISGGAGIGGVLEPMQANPTIIEDHCFIGARSEIVEGVIVEANSVIAMGVFIGQSTKIFNRNDQTISYGRVPAGSVVVPGSLPSDDGTHQVYAAIIVKQVDAKTRQKVSINELLRH